MDGPHLSIGLFQKKSKQVGTGGYTFLQPPWNFRFVTLPSEILGKTSFYSWKSEILQNCVPPFGNSKVKNEDPRKFPTVFFLNLQKFHFFFNWTLGFLRALSLEWKFHVLNPWPPYLDFFWNSQLLKMSSVKLQQKMQIWSMSMDNKRLENQYHKISSLEFEG